MHVTARLKNSSLHATFKPSSAAGDRLKRASLTTRLRTLMIGPARARALLLTQAPIVSLICISKMAFWSATQLTTNNSIRPNSTNCSQVLNKIVNIYFFFKNKLVHK